MESESKTPPPDEASSETKASEGASLASLDDDQNSLEYGDDSPTGGAPIPPPPEEKTLGLLRSLFRKLNIYLILFVAILLIAGGVIYFSYSQNNKLSTSTISAQTLTQNTLNQLANSDASVGSPKEILNIESNAVFAGQVLVREAVEVAGNFQVSGSTTLQDLNVSGQSVLNTVQINKGLSVIGNTAIQGQETISQSLQVNGSGTFSGAVSAPELTTNSLLLNGDLTLDHHIVAGGPTPTRQDGVALGNGGTVTISGSDTSGSVAINTGSNTAAGCFVSVYFTSTYALIPHVLLTPVGANAGGLAYYVTHTASSFSICDATAPPASVSFGFDYLVID